MDNDNSINCYSSAGLTELTLCQLSLEYDAAFNSLIIIPHYFMLVKYFFKNREKFEKKTFKSPLKIAYFLIYLHIIAKVPSFHKAITLILYNVTYYITYYIFERGFYK